MASGILRWLIIVAAISGATLRVAPAVAHDTAPPQSATAAGPGLDRGLGSLHHPVTTRQPLAQAWFDQGMRLMFAFNHPAAIASFERAAEIDPNLAMAQWGIALSWGPNYNMPMSPENHRKAYAALQRAIVLESGASSAERAYIDALAPRYSENADADTAALSLAYKNAMGNLVRRYPDDIDAKVLYAESLMDLHPWKLWGRDGTANEDTPEIVGVLESVLARQPDHIGAIHYYIHAVEASSHPEKALPYARRLPSLAPSAGHLVHMPAHTYIRTGRYVEAVAINEAAARADERLLAAGLQSDYLVGYYGHNLHFIAVCSAFAGNSEQALAAAEKLHAYQAQRVAESPWVDGFLYTPDLVRVQFGRWKEILAGPEPAFEAPMTGALWLFARTIALAASGRPEEARNEHAKFLAAVETIPRTLDNGNNSARAMFGVAVPYLDGRLALFDGNIAGAITQLRQAVAAEDALAYDEPPTWYLPSRQALGAALLAAGDLPAAEQVFRDDLHVNRENGRALFGLQAALARQGKTGEAAAAQQRFARAWRKADVTLATPVL
jgi:tetratricopeptide (TPR) repeat protein